MTIPSAILKIGKTILIYRYKFADVVWEIPVRSEQLKNMLSPFICDEKQADEVLPQYPEDIELEMFLREISRRLLQKYQGLMLHGAAIVYKEKAYLFTAPSGTGKTTHIRLWQKQLKENLLVLCGDKPFIRLEEGCAMVYGSPWKGKEGLGNSGKCVLGGIYILERAQQNSITEAKSMQKLEALLQAVFFEKNTEQRIKTIELLQRLCEKVPVYLLSCNMDISAQKTVQEHIDGVLNED